MRSEQIPDRKDESDIVLSEQYDPKDQIPFQTDCEEYGICRRRIS